MLPGPRKTGYAFSGVHESKRRLFTISDSPDFNSKSLTGTGKLRGNPWDWSYLTFDMVYSGDKFSMKIDDANFVVGNQLIGRKQFFYRNPSPSPNEVGTPVELWDIEMTQIDQATYALHGKEMGCPSPSKR